LGFEASFSDTALVGVQVVLVVPVLDVLPVDVAVLDVEVDVLAVVVVFFPLALVVDVGDAPRPRPPDVDVVVVVFAGFAAEPRPAFVVGLPDVEGLPDWLVRGAFDFGPGAACTALVRMTPAARAVKNAIHLLRIGSCLLGTCPSNGRAPPRAQM
jgi:hypothetical protein